MELGIKKIPSAAFLAALSILPSIGAAPPISSYSDLLQSFLIILREGFEIVLLSALLLLSLKDERDRKHVLRGIAGGLAFSLLLAAGFLSIVSSSGSLSHGLEAFFSLVAAAVLLICIRGLRWTPKKQAERKHPFLIGLLSFAAVAREGTEIALFYAALLASGAAKVPVLYGLAAGIAALLAISLAFFRLGKRIPLRHFFVATSVLLSMLALIFAGRGIHELQEMGLISETKLLPLEAESIGFFPNVEVMAFQLFVGAALLAAFMNGAPERRGQHI